MKVNHVRWSDLLLGPQINRRFVSCWCPFVKTGWCTSCTSVGVAVVVVFFAPGPALLAAPSPRATGGGDHPLHDGVEARARRALDAKEVPIHTSAPRPAIVAEHVDHPRQVGGHGLHGYVARPRVPRRPHGLAAQYRLLAYRAPPVESGEVAEAVDVDGVPAREVLGGLARGEHVLAAHRAVVLVLVWHACTLISARCRRSRHHGGRRDTGRRVRGKRNVNLK